MPLYELSMVLRTLPRADIAATLKRTGCILIEKGAKIKKLENLGIDRDLPYKFFANDMHHTKGSYFVYSFVSSAKIFPDILDTCLRDVDILKHYIGVSYKDVPHDCTLHEEMLPPAERQSVQDLLQKSKKNKEKTKPFYWSDRNYNWFHTHM